MASEPYDEQVAQTLRRDIMETFHRQKGELSDERQRQILTRIADEKLRTWRDVYAWHIAGPGWEIVVTSKS